MTRKTRHQHRSCPISAYLIASQLVHNGVYKSKNRESARLVTQEVSKLWRISTLSDKCISGDFFPEEFSSAIQLLKSGKVPGSNSIYPQLIFYADAALNWWLNKFLPFCIRQPLKIWKEALAVAFSKPNKPTADPKIYRPIFLLCIPCKTLEILIYVRAEPIIIDPLLPREQVGFRRGMSTVDQVTHLTQEIEDSFLAKKKVGAVFINLTATYDTVWHRGLTESLCIFCQAGTCSQWPRSLPATAISPLQSVLAPLRSMCTLIL